MNPFKPYIKKFKTPFIASTFFLAVEAICDVIQPTLLAFLVDKGVRTGNLSIIVHYSLLMFVVTCVGAINALMRNYLAAQVSFKLGRDLRKDLFEKAIFMSARTRLKFDQGTLMTRLTNDVNQIQNFITGLMRIFLKAPLLGLGSMWMVYHLNQSLFHVFLVLLPLMVLLIALNLKWGYPLFVKVQQSIDQLNGRMREFLSGIRVVKAFHSFKYEQLRFDQINQESTKRLSKAIRVLSVFGPLMSFMVQMSIVYVLYQSHIWIKVGDLGLGMLMGFIQYMLQFLFALMIITRVFNLFVRGKSSAHRVGEILSLPLERRQSIQETNDDDLSIESISFNAVDFAYAKGSEVLKNIQFKVEKGQRIGIIGMTGSGKTSLIELLLGFYKPKSGGIQINGLDCSLDDLKAYRKCIGYVPQKTILFTGTIEENLRWGPVEVSREEIERAVDIAQIGTFIRDLKEGYETHVGRGGVNLSGGQKQRLAIARAILVRPDLLIFDDSTSALDGLTEYELEKNLYETFSGLTTITITQRVSSVIHADRILVLHEGQIEGYDTHSKLLENSVLYREIYETQMGNQVLI